MLLSYIYILLVILYRLKIHILLAAYGLSIRLLFAAYDFLLVFYGHLEALIYSVFALLEDLS